MTPVSSAAQDPIPVRFQSHPGPVKVTLDQARALLQHATEVSSQQRRRIRNKLAKSCHRIRDRIRARTISEMEQQFQRATLAAAQQAHQGYQQLLKEHKQTIVRLALAIAEEVLATELTNSEALTARVERQIADETQLRHALLKLPVSANRTRALLLDRYPSLPIVMDASLTEGRALLQLPAGEIDLNPTAHFQEISLRLLSEHEPVC